MLTKLAPLVIFTSKPNFGAYGRISHLLIIFSLSNLVYILITPMFTSHVNLVIIGCKIFLPISSSAPLIKLPMSKPLQLTLVQSADTNGEHTPTGRDYNYKHCECWMCIKE